MLLGITGTDGAGKGTVVEYLKTKNFVHYSGREFIVEEIERQGLSVNRNQMRLTANQMRAEYGDDFIAKHAFEKAQKAGEENVVIESIRATAEAEFVKKNKGILLAVDADSEIRYQRVQSRRSETDQVSYEQFLEHEELEKNDPDPHGMQKSKVIAMADYKVNNNGNLDELHQQVDKFLDKFSY